MKRKWMAHRGAYAPRAWPQMAVATPIGVGLTFVTRALVGTGWLSIVGYVLSGFLTAVVVTQVAWWRWRRKHPMLRLTPEDVARLFDVPPWVVGLYPRPRLARLRWRLRRVWPGLVWPGARRPGASIEKAQEIATRLAPVNGHRRPPHD